MKRINYNAPCEAIEAVFSWGVSRCGANAVGWVFDDVGAKRHVCSEHEERATS